jgi:hypothetical protein
MGILINHLRKNEKRGLRRVSDREQKRSAKANAKMVWEASPNVKAREAALKAMLIRQGIKPDRRKNGGQAKN